jgi:TonB family protein
MNSAIRPISVSTAFSLLLHASLAIAILQTQDVMQATGNGLEIELVSSITFSTQTETEQAASKATALAQQNKPAEQLQRSNINAPSGSVDGKEKSVMQELASVAASDSDSLDNDSGKKTVSRSTNAAMHSNSIIELLHTKISEHKQYPYMARRQRREGIARVEFVLHPDGSINDAHLVHSSRTRSLDNAAIEAVKSIEPFTLAKDYIDQPEAYQVDVVFNVL